MGAGLDEIDRRRSAFKRRLRQLESLHTDDVQKLGAALVEFVQVSEQLAWTMALSAVANCFSDLVRRTPVDTGRARAGWMFTTESTQTVPPPGEYAEYKADIAAAVDNALAGVNLDEATVVYITNNVEYILALEAGWSKEQAGGFIALFLAELTQQLEAATRHFSK